MTFSQDNFTNFQRNFYNIFGGNSPQSNKNGNSDDDGNDNDNDQWLNVIASGLTHARHT